MMLRQSHQRNNPFLRPRMSVFAMTGCNVVLTKIFTKVHGIVRDRQTPSIAISHESMQQVPLIEKMTWMVSVKRCDPTFVLFENVGPKYLRNQLPPAITLTSENELGGW